MHSSISLSISLPSFSPLLNLSPHLFVTKQQRILRIFSFLHSIFIGIPLSLPSFQQANLITTSKYKQPHHTLQLQFHPSEIDRATHIQQLCKNVGIKSHLSSPAANQPLQPPQPKRAVIDLEKIPDTLEDIMMEEQKTPPQTQKNKKRPRSPSPSPSPSPTPAPALPPPSPSPPPSPKSYDLRSRKIIFQNFESQVSPIPPQKIPIPKNRPQKPQNMNSPNLKLLPPPPPSHCFGDPVYTYEYQLPNYPSHWRFRIFYNPRNKYYYYLSYGNVVDFDKFCKARRVV